MNAFEQVITEIQQKPDLEILDDSVRYIHDVYANNSTETEWLARSHKEGEAYIHPDNCPRIKVMADDTAWRYLTFHRETTKYGRHESTTAECYRRVGKGVLRTTYRLTASGVRPKLEIDCGTVDPKEMHDNMVENWPVDIQTALSQYYDKSINIAEERPTRLKCPSSVWLGSRVMRLAERKHIGISPKFD